VEDEEGREDRKKISPLRIRLIGFVILSVASIIVLGLLGAPPLLILEVFSLAAILAISAILIIIVLGGRTRIRR
jgi:hypothetical protein